jgi:hypothetical protein
MTCYPGEGPSTVVSKTLPIPETILHTGPVIPEMMEVEINFLFVFDLSAGKAVFKQCYCLFFSTLHSNFKYIIYSLL